MFKNWMNICEMQLEIDWKELHSGSRSMSGASLTRMSSSIYVGGMTITPKHFSKASRSVARDVTTVNCSVLSTSSIAEFMTA
jgi:hypothetical protein